MDREIGYICTVRNSSKSLTERKNALLALSRIGISNDSIFAVGNLLHDLIQYDEELAAAAFRAFSSLVATAPDGFVMAIKCFRSLSQIASDVSIAEISAPVMLNKCTEETMQLIVRLLIHIIQTDEVKELEAVNFLKKMVDFYREAVGLLSDDSIRKLVFHLERSKRSSVRCTIVDILERTYVDQTRVTIYVHPALLRRQRELANLTLSDRDIDRALLLLREMVNEGIIIPEDKILMLVSGLEQRSLEKYRRDIVVLLLKIEQNQGLSDEIFITGILGEKSLNRASLLHMIICDTRVQELSNPAGQVGTHAYKKKIQKEEEEQEVEQEVEEETKDSEEELFYSVFEEKEKEEEDEELEEEEDEDEEFEEEEDDEIKSAEEEETEEEEEFICQMPDADFRAAANVMTNAFEEVEVRINAVKFVSMHLCSSSSMQPYLEQAMVDVALQNDVDDWRLNKCAFEALRLSIIPLSIFSPTWFIEMYYDRLRISLIQQQMITTVLAEFLTRLDSYIADEAKSVMDKVDLLACLNNNVLIGCLDCDIFSEFDERDWRREILYGCLLHYALKSESVSDVQTVDDFELKSFGDNLSSLQAFLLTCGDSNGSFETLLQAVVERRISDLKTLNNMLFYMWSTLDASDIVLSSTDSVIMLLELQKVWLEKKLLDAGIKFTAESLTTLSKYLSFKVELVDQVLTVIRRNTTIESLTDFFHILTDCTLTREMKEDFLINNSVTDTCPVSLNLQLAALIIKQYILDKRDRLNVDVNGRPMLKLRDRLTKLLLGGWAIESIAKLLKLINSDSSLHIVLQTTIVINEYRLREYSGNAEGQSLMCIIVDHPCVVDLERKVHDLAIFQSFSQPHDSDLKQLRNEIMNLNSDGNIHFIPYMDQYNEVMDAYDKKCPGLTKCTKCIKDWSKSDIELWAKMKDQRAIKSQSVRIAVVKRAAEIVNNFPPRDMQLLTVILMLNSTENKGTLAQIATGEGKTIVVAMIAVLKVLDGHKVDVVTSSPELAIPQAKQQERFYGMFGLTVAHNCGRLSHCGIVSAYDADVVYGDALSFQADILRDECCKQNIRRGRSCDVAIVDEVDSMLIDSRNHILRLSSSIPAMDNLEPLLAAIWLQIAEAEKCICEEDGTTYYVKNENVLDEKTGKRNPEAVEMLYPLECSKAEFIKQSTLLHIRRMLRDREHMREDQLPIPDEYPEIKIPNHLREFVTGYQIEHWINSAISAKYRYKKDEYYVIEDGNVVPVDAVNTGVVQWDTHWSDGFHQFLQMKHGAKISPEDLTVNFISNVVYFRRYDSLYGLSGTLGSTSTVRFLQNVYSVGIIYIPPFRPKQHVHLPTELANTRDEWYRCIVESCLRKLVNGRAVLIITRYIDEAKEIIKAFEGLNYDRTKIRSYTTNKESSSVQTTLNEGELIVATIIAGRGTDIKVTNSVEINGGLHVCLSFLPLNTRVEEQNIGRTSRMGNKGTSQFVLLQKDEKNIDDLIRERDRNEEQAVEQALQDVEEVVCQDEIFSKFRKLVDSVCRTYTLDEYKVRGLEERFAIWLKQQGENLGDRELLYKNFETFKKVVSKDCPDNLIKNPHYYILTGNRSVRAKNWDDAITHYNEAIRMDVEFAEFAYYNRGFARLAKYGSEATTHGSSIYNAIRDLRTAKTLIEQRESHLHFIQSASHGEALSEQVCHKMMMYAMLKNAIDAAVGIGVDAIDKEIRDLSSALTTAEKQYSNGLTAARKQESAKKVKEIKESRKNLRNYKESKELGVVGQTLKKGRCMTVNLISMNESLPSDQDASLYKDEIKEAEGNGLLGTFQVQEIQPINWGHVAGLAVLGITQLLAGSALAVFTLGAGFSIGLGLVSEGVSDLITTVMNGIIKRDFNWASWAIQKTVSFIVSVSCAGWSAIEDVCKTACSVGNFAVTQTTKAGWKIAAKAIGTSIAKGIGKELLTQIVNCGVDNVVMPYIEEQIINTIQPRINQYLSQSTRVQDLLKTDSRNRNKHYSSLIMELAVKILSKSKQEDSAFLQIAEGIAKGVAANKLNKIKVLSALSQSAEVAKALVELVTFVDIFITKLDNVIASECKVEADKPAACSEIGDRTRRERSYMGKSAPVHDDGDDIVWGQETEEQVKLERGDLNEQQLCSELSSRVSSEMSKIVQTKLVAPATGFAINSGLNSVMKGLDKHVEKEIGDFQAERRIVATQNGDEKMIPDEHKRGFEDDQAVAEANRLISAVEDGGPLGLYNLQAVSQTAKKQLKVLNKDGKTVHIIGDPHHDVIEVQYHEPNAQNPNGHWTLPGGKEPSITSPGKNDCLLNVVAHQTGYQKAASCLRRDVVEHMKNNVGSLANQVNDIKRLERFKNRALKLGGLPRYDKTNTEHDAKKVLENSEKTVPYLKCYDEKCSGNKVSNDKSPCPHIRKFRVSGHTMKKHVGKPGNEAKKNTTAFITERDAEKITHQMLIMANAKNLDIYNKLNNGEYRVTFTCSAEDLDGTYNMWKIDSTGQAVKVPAKSFTCVIGHIDGEQANPDAIPHVQTVYPSDRPKNQDLKFSRK